MTGVQGLDSFNRLVAALEPWLDQVVVIGGWAHQLYRLHPHAQALDYPPLTTLDTDVAVPANLPARKQDIRARLLAEDRPPATHYRLGGESSGFYAEFLTPLVGSGYDRKQRRKATMEIAGIVSQQLRHIELLLHQPWSIDLKSGGLATHIQVPNPVSFLAQRVLIHEKRERADRAKDILYLHDTLEVFGTRLPELQGLWRHTVAPQLPPRSKKKVSKASEDLFGELTDDVRRAAEISAERVLSPKEIREACRYGFIQVFG
uniref:Nucleotidyltransferase-like domain-containing protein n=1 Tax=Solibacter usitatus (strain Ellin6076) TaxID=234267 RepID=Q01P65_SOLUE